MAEINDLSLVITGDEIDTVRRALTRSQQILVITGAGISADSGLRTFRGDGGWWRDHKAEELATLRAFKQDPVKIWEWYDERRQAVAIAAPNSGHLALAEWEKEGKNVFIITQNVDDLHERAGSSNVVHIHGFIWEVRCMNDGKIFTNTTVPLATLPPLCPECNGLLRPNIVWFDEELGDCEVKRIEDYFDHTKVDIVFAIGTEATFDYIRDYALRARTEGAMLVEINPDKTKLTPGADFHLGGPAGEVLALLR
jgi:NAD-dependent deacetylase